jgi:hypothetical protein
MKKTLLAWATSVALLSSAAGAQAQRTLSDASLLSALPVAISVAVPASMLVGGAALSVVSVTAVSEGTVIVLERVADGTGASVLLASGAAGTLSMASGTVVVVTALATGWLLSTAGQVIAFIPNELGRALLYNERVL